MHSSNISEPDLTFLLSHSISISKIFSMIQEVFENSIRKKLFKLKSIEKFDQSLKIFNLSKPDIKYFENLPNELWN